MSGAALLSGFGGGPSAYLVVFGVSSLARLAALALLIGVAVRRIPVVHVCMRVLGVRPAVLSIDSPVLSTLERPAADGQPAEASPG